MLSFRRNLGEAGDTIIEVLMALAVLGLAISISYATANSSLTAVRQAEENNKATKYIQSQIETLRAKTAVVGGFDIYDKNTWGGATTFCFNAALAPKNSTSVADCQRDGLYNLSINYTADNPAVPVRGEGTFKVTATWQDLRNTDPATVSMSYRVYP